MLTHHVEAGMLGMSTTVKTENMGVVVLITAPFNLLFWPLQRLDEP